MVSKGPFNPQTGADSVPLPEAGGDQDLRWSEYWAKCRQAAEAETVEQAVARCRGQAGDFDVERRFDAVLAVMTETFDERLANPLYAGLSLDESGFFAEYLIDDLRQFWKAMSAAFDAGDRDAYRKAAADFCKAAAIMSFGVIAPSDEEVTDA